MSTELSQKAKDEIRHEIYLEVSKVTTIAVETAIGRFREESDCTKSCPLIAAIDGDSPDNKIHRFTVMFDQLEKAKARWESAWGRIIEALIISAIVGAALMAQKLFGGK